MVDLTKIQHAKWDNNQNEGITHGGRFQTRSNSNYSLK